MDYKQITAERVKALDDGNGGFTGYASTWDNWDSVMERPVRGAFQASLPDFIKHGFIALGHSWDALPIATVTDATEDDYGLLITTEFHGTDAAQAARRVLTERINRGKSAKLSIGYEVMRDRWVQDPPGGRLLEEIKLFEVSLVNVPANPQASITAAKSVPPAGLTMEQHSDSVLAAVKELSTRVSSLRELRAKEGRTLSAANRQRIQQHLEALDAIRSDFADLLAATEPKADPDTVKALYLEYQRILAQHNGVRQ